MFKVRELDNSFVTDVAKLHLEYLNTPFQGKAGIELLYCYYETLLTQIGGICYIITAENQLAGFICGIWSPKLIQKNLFKKQWGKLLFWGGLHLLRNPKMVFDFASRFFQNSKKVGMDLEKKYELRPIVVAKKFQGKKVASLLLEKLCDDAVSRSFKEIILFTEKDNLPAQKFYLKNDFKLKEINPNEKLLFEKDLNFYEP